MHTKRALVLRRSSTGHLLKPLIAVAVYVRVIATTAVTARDQPVVAVTLAEVTATNHLKIN